MTKPPGITCADWESAGDKNRPKRCKYMAKERESELTEEQLQGSKVSLGNGFVWRGACMVNASVVDGAPRLICEEWLKVHPEDALRPPPAPLGARDRLPTLPSVLPANQTTFAPPPSASNAASALPPVARDLFGGIVPDPKPAQQVSPRRAPTGSSLPGAISWPSVFSETWFADLIQSGGEFQFNIPSIGDVFVVRRRTNADRRELLYSELLLLWFAHSQGFVLEKIRTPEEAERDRSEREAKAGRTIHDLVVSPEVEERCKKLDPRTGVPKDELEKRMRELDPKTGMPGGGLK